MNLSFDKRTWGCYCPNMRKQPPHTNKIPAKMIKRLLQPQEGQAP